MKQLIFILFFGLGTTISAQDAGLLSGKVVEQESGSGVAFATLEICVDSTIIIGYTDENGYFNLYDTPFGQLTISASNIGYEPSATVRLIFDENVDRVHIVKLKEKDLVLP